MKKGLLILGLIALFCFFVYKYWDADADLGNGYYFLTEYEAKDIGFPDGAVVYKSPRKNVIADIKIPATVIRAEVIDDYIVGIQIQNDTVKKYFLIQKDREIIYKDLNKKEFFNICSKIGIKPF